MIFHIIFIDQLTNQKGGQVHRSLQPAHQIPGTICAKCNGDNKLRKLVSNSLVPNS